MDIITLTTKKDLDTYMNPRRQQLLRVLRLTGTAMTPKQLADHLGISASSVQHHVGRLVELGILELDHTAVINGITAVYYRRSGKAVSFLDGNIEGLGDINDRLLMAQNIVSSVLNGYFTAVRNTTSSSAMADVGDMTTGIVHLKPGSSEQLLRLIHSFVLEHYDASEDSEPWEFALIAYSVNKAEMEAGRNA